MKQKKGMHKKKHKNKHKGGNNMSNITKSRIGFTRECHKPTEIFRHLWLMNEDQFSSIAVPKRIDVAIPLLSVGSDIWNKGWNGVIYSVPIADYKTLPGNVERKKVREIVEFIKEGLNVAIFCMGGHGRTGYLASLVLYELGIPNPIEYIRKNYCESAVESNVQLQAIASYMGDDTILQTNLSQKYSYYSSDDNRSSTWSSTAWYKDKCKTCTYFLPDKSNNWKGFCTVGGILDTYVEAKQWETCHRHKENIVVIESKVEKDTCGTCGFYSNLTGICKEKDIYVEKNQNSCNMFY